MNSSKTVNRDYYFIITAILGVGNIPHSVTLFVREYHAPRDFIRVLIYMHRTHTCSTYAYLDAFQARKESRDNSKKKINK